MVGAREWEPDRYGISQDDFVVYRQVWELCESYSTHSGGPPSVELLAARVPSFPFTPSVNPAWAAEELRRESDDLWLRRGMSAASTDLHTGDVESAREKLTDAVDRTGQRALHWDEGLDTALAPSYLGHSLDVPWHPLQEVTGGLRPGELWYVGARFGHGKSWLLCRFVAQAMMAGARVHYLSLEMPSPQVTSWVASCILGSTGHDIKAIQWLASGDQDDRQKAIDRAKQLAEGRMRVTDSSHVEFASPAYVTRCARDADLVAVDHVALLVPNGSTRNAATWEIVRAISKQLKQVANRTRTPIIAAAQVNRVGANRKKMPTADNLAESDHLGRDADVVVMMRRLGDSVMQLKTDKVRNGPKAGWFAAFEPARGRFSEISRQEAMSLARFDDDDE